VFSLDSYNKMKSHYTELVHEMYIKEAEKFLADYNEIDFITFSVLGECCSVIEAINYDGETAMALLSDTADVVYIYCEAEEVFGYFDFHNAIPHELMLDKYEKGSRVYIRRNGWELESI
jgi:hypothetical protein